jgi:hypothetical protein
VGELRRLGYVRCDVTKNGNAKAMNGSTDEMAKGESNGKRTVKEYISLITAAYTKNVESIFAIGDLLNEAKAELEWGEFEHMVARELPFGDSMARKYRAVAAKAFFRSHVNEIPARLGTLYELSHLDDKVLEDMLADGKLNPDIERKEVEAIREEVNYDQHYVWHELREALTKLIAFMGKWPDAKEPVEYLTREHPKEKENIDWYRIGDAGQWLIKLHHACEQHEAEADAAWAEHEANKAPEEKGKKEKERSRKERFFFADRLREENGTSV